MRPEALLVLEDGFTLAGEAFAGDGEALGEVVFTTSVTGYQEALTDPSYKGQILAFTHPHVGNCGVNQDDMESEGPCVEALLVRDYSDRPSSWRARESLGAFLERHGVLGVAGVDTRALTRHVRVHGAMKGAVSTVTRDVSLLRRRASEWPGLLGRDTVRYVTASEPYEWRDPLASPRWPVAVMDFGVKRSILKMLARSGCRVMVYPAYTPAREVLAGAGFGEAPLGVVLSNGPGDPAGLPSVVEEVKQMIGKTPLLGICLGHQILGLALGMSTFKLKFGHRGSNHPVRYLATGRVEITSQNHGFCVAWPGKEGSVEVTHVNLNDGTLEGMQHRGVGFISVQFHPEASPGPHDSRYVFDQFVDMVAAGSRR